MAGWSNDIAYAKNCDFSKAANTTPSETNGLYSDGDIWIGSTALNGGGTHVNVGKITSLNGSLSIAYGPGSIDLSVTAFAILWQNISADQTLSTNLGYFCVSPGGNLSLALPAVSNVGDQIEVSLDGATSWTITQGAGQQIRIGNLATTAGVAGSLSSNQQGDSIRMICRTANLLWNVISSMGNPIII